MDSVTQAEVLRLAAAAHAGTIHFGQLVVALTALGIESYRADYRTRETTYFTPAGGTVRAPLATAGIAVGEAFDADAVQAAIRGSQRGEVRYPEFVARSMAAGCVGYSVWIAGRHVAYYGRRGETHIEPFPGGK